MIGQGYSREVRLVVFPGLCLTAYTCTDLSGQKTLLREAREELDRVARFTDGKGILVFLGLPWERDGKLYSVATVIQKGRFLGIVPKRNPPNYSGLYEVRSSCPDGERTVVTNWNGEEVPAGTNLLLKRRDMPELTAMTGICEDMWVPCPPSIRHTLTGATVIVNCPVSGGTAGKDVYRHNLICNQSVRLVRGYVYANTGEGESTQDSVFGDQDTIAKDGICPVRSRRSINESIRVDMDLGRLDSKRRRMSTFPDPAATREEGEYLAMEFNLDVTLKGGPEGQNTQAAGSS